jgi:hypothetical protein
MKEGAIIIGVFQVVGIAKKIEMLYKIAEESYRQST